MLLGAAYYPEHRDPTRWEFDLDQMAAASVNCLRVGEFAWTRFEPSDCVYRFDWMDAFNELAAERNIRLMMCPPLRTAPAWLVQRDPNLLILREDGLRLGFGSRYTFCINQPLLREKGAQLATALARHYGPHQNIAGWHLDNEHGDEPDCHCPLCQKKFQAWCQRQYQTIDNLNEKWGLVFWSLEFSSFEQIPTPSVSKTYHAPGHLLAWRRFRSESIVETVAMQADALRAQIPAGQFITTNHQTWNPHSDYYQMAKHLDISGTNYYPPYGDGSPFMPWALTRCRSYKQRNFQVHELRNGAHMAPGMANNTPAPGEVERLALHCVANGADALIFFRWRSAPFGAEQTHGTLTDYDGHPKRVYFEVQRAFDNLTRLRPLLENTRIRSQAAVLHDFPTWWVMDSGAHWNGPIGLYFKLAQQAFENLRSACINVDAVAMEQDFTPYKLIVLPVLATVDDAGAKKLVDFVEQGGTLVWHPMTGVKDPDTRIYPERLHPRLQAMLGVEIREFATLSETESAPFDWNGKTYQGSMFCDLPKILDNNQTHTLGAYQQVWFSGTPAVLECKAGQGRVIFITTFAESTFYRDLYAWLCPQAGLERIVAGELPEGLEVTARTAEDGRKFVFLHNTRAQTQTLMLAEPVEDIYNQETVGPQVTLAPYGVRILIM